MLGVIGAGQMGTGIGIVGSAVADLNVVFADPSEVSLKKCEAMATNWCDKEIKKERMTEARKSEILGRITYTDSLKSLNNVDFVVEAASEDF